MDSKVKEMIAKDAKLMQMIIKGKREVGYKTRRRKIPD
jgi:hypothetical protein